MKKNEQIKKKEPKINKRDISRMKELNDQTQGEDKIVVKKLENKKLEKQVYVTGYNWLHNSVQAIVITPEGRSNGLIKIKDIEDEEGLLPVYPFKEKSLSELELLPESAGNQILLELYNWATGKNKDEDNDKEKVTDLKSDEKSKQEKELAEIQQCRTNNTTEQSIQR